jgi:hypothetical protein
MKTAFDWVAIWYYAAMPFFALGVICVLSDIYASHTDDRIIKRAMAGFLAALCCCAFSFLSRN